MRNDLDDKMQAKSEIAARFAMPKIKEHEARRIRDQTGEGRRILLQFESYLQRDHPHERHQKLVADFSRREDGSHR